MGGLPAGPVPQDDHDHALWEKRVDALMVLCSSRGLFTVDGLRRAIEDLGPADYERLGYYERWIAAVARNLVDAGVFTNAELGQRMEEVAQRGDTYGDAAAEPRSGDAAAAADPRPHD